MKGNCIVRKMRQLGNITATCMEAGSEMVWEDKYTTSNNRKALNRIGRQMARAQKSLDMIWKHNVPHKARKEEEEAFFNTRK